jgi:lipid II:glycine glycyltransferase (peptidoglycan interpeptide bridge formation enzyme)
MTLLMPFRVMNEISSVIETSTDGYTVEMDNVNEDQWNSILDMFDDANLMQTWSYGAARWGAAHLSHVLLKNKGTVVAAAQAVIRKVPLLGAGLAYIKWGPVWRLRGGANDPETLRQMLRALRDFYEIHRSLALRIFPPGTEDGSGLMRSIFREEGFEHNLSMGVPRTAFIDLSHSLEQLRSSLKPTWRRNLVLAERNNLTIRHGTSDSLFETFAKLYGEMLDRKNVVRVVGIAHFKQIQRTLPEALKMTVMICEHEGEPVAGLVVPSLGSTAQNLLAATGSRGLALRGSYLLHWRMLEWLKSHGCRWYDLDAINHKDYPGISQFKTGFAGRLGWEAEYLGQFDSCSNVASQSLVRTVDLLMRTYVAIRFALSRWNYPRFRQTPAN